MTIKEIVAMTQAIISTGKKLNLPGRVADKHCLPGDTPLLIKNSGEIKTKTIGEVVESIFEQNKNKIIQENNAYYLEDNFNNLNILTWNDNYKVHFTSVVGFYKVKSPKKSLK